MIAGNDVEASRRHAFAEVLGIGRQLIPQRGGCGQHIDRFDGRADDAGGHGIGEQVGAGALAQDVDDLLAGGGKAAGGTPQRLAVGAGDDVDPAHYAPVLVDAAAGLTDEAGGVAFVDHHHGVVLIGQVADLVELGDGAVHGEGAVGDDEFAAGVGCFL